MMQQKLTAYPDTPVKLAMLIGEMEEADSAALEELPMKLTDLEKKPTRQQMAFL